MKSFPSSPNKGGTLVPQYPPGTSGSILSNIVNQVKTAFFDAFNSVLKSKMYGITSAKEVKIPNTDGIPYNLTQDYQGLLTHHDMASNEDYIGMTRAMSSSPDVFVDPFKFDRDALEMMDVYKYKLDGIKNFSGAVALNPKGSNADDKYLVHGTESSIAPSLFNPYFGVNVKGMTKNTPLHDYDLREQMKDYSDCTVKTLVELSKMSGDDPGNELGLARYKYADFMYCKDIGIPNNRMITLRKFGTPVGDNIFVLADTTLDDSPGNWQKSRYKMTADVGRMVTWFDNEDNKLEDIMKYNYNATWKEINAKIDQQHSQETQRESPLGMLLNSTNPSFNNSINEGTTSGNNIISWLASTWGFKTAESWYAGHKILTNYDNNRIYTPLNTVQSTHLYEGKLQFNQEISLVFRYKMRSYNNINQKAAFLDLIANILQVTYMRGSFWGGRNEIIGDQPNVTGWKKSQAFVNRSFSELGSMFASLESGTNDISAISGMLSNLGSNAINLLSELGFGSLINGLQQGYQNVKDGKLADAAKSTMKGAVDTIKKTGIGSAVKGVAKNMLGRPQLYAFDSLLSGDNVGLWHLTIGNPRNPIAAFGNLIMTDAEIQHLGPLGIDDFPTELKVTVKLKHARPRDKVAIEKMYTCGVSAIHINIGVNQKSGAALYNHTSKEALPYIGEHRLQGIARNCEELT